VIVRAARNLLLNPVHPRAAEVHILAVGPFRFDLAAGGDMRRSRSAPRVAGQRLKLLRTTPRLLQEADRLVEIGDLAATGIGIQEPALASRYCRHSAWMACNSSRRRRSWRDRCA